MSEASLWDATRFALHGLDPVRVENAAGVGTPDVNYMEGWLELKWLERWPKRAKSIVRVDHYVPEQKAWHMRRCWNGGECYVLIQIDRDVLLLWGADAAKQLGKINKEDLMALTLFHWASIAEMKEKLKDALKKNKVNPG